jgi:integrase/recombinase XerD
MADAGFTHAAGADIPHSATSRRGMLPALAGLAVGLAYATISVYWAVGGRWLLNTVGISPSQPGQAGHLAALLAVWGAAGRCPMTTATPSTALATIQPAFTDPERLAPAGFLAGYRGLTREAYALDLRQFTTWCRARSLPLFAVRRADIESFARELEFKGRARTTVTRRLCTIAGFCKYAVEEELLEHSPAAHVRRLRLDYESHAVALDRNELGALLVAAGLGPPIEHALISLLALNGLRVSEATGADIEHLGLERGHRTLTITRKGGKVVTIPLAPRTARAIDLAIGERTDGPVFLAGDGRRLDRHGAGRIVRKIARRTGIGKAVTPHTLRHAFITAALDAGVPLRDVQEAASHADPRTTIRYDRARGSLDRHATYIVAAYVAGAAR